MSKSLSVTLNEMCELNEVLCTATENVGRKLSALATLKAVKLYNQAYDQKIRAHKSTSELREDFHSTLEKLYDAVEEFKGAVADATSYDNGLQLDDRLICLYDSLYRACREALEQLSERAFKDHLGSMMEFDEDELLALADVRGRNHDNRDVSLIVGSRLQLQSFMDIPGVMMMSDKLFKLMAAGSLMPSYGVDALTHSKARNAVRRDIAADLMPLASKIRKALVNYGQLSTSDVNDIASKVIAFCDEKLEMLKVSDEDWGSAEDADRTCFDVDESGREQQARHEIAMELRERLEKLTSDFNNSLVELRKELARINKLVTEDVPNSVRANLGRVYNELGKLDLYNK